MEIRFLNLDIVIHSQEDLTLLNNELKDRVLILHNGLIEGENGEYYLLSFEADLDTDIPNASESLTLNLCKIINNLSPRSGQIWNQCDRKVFDYGYESGLQPSSFSNELSSKAIAQIASLEASIATTIYPYQLESQQ